MWGRTESEGKLEIKGSIHSLVLLFPVCLSISLQELAPFSSLFLSVLSWPLFPPLFAFAEFILIP